MAATEKSSIYHLPISFWAGWATLADPVGEGLAAIESDYYLSGQEEDRQALSGDLRRVGQDFQRAIQIAQDE